MSKRITVLTGGVGGAKLVEGLQRMSSPPGVTAIVNTGDDFTHLGLSVSPDLDTLLYTLSDKSDREKGWGRAGESWNFMAAVKSLGGPDWFSLGDADMALHVLRTQRLRSGECLSAIIADFASAWQIDTKILPMSEDPVATQIETNEGWLAFQDYFVRRRCEPELRAVSFSGATVARPAKGVVDAIRDKGCHAVLIAPSNPYLSIDPILAVPGIRAALLETDAPIIAISPLVGGEAVKGPTAKIMRELGLDVTAQAISNHYAGIINGILVDERDDAGPLSVAFRTADILMNDLDDRIRVAETALSFADDLRK